MNLKKISFFLMLSMSAWVSVQAQSEIGYFILSGKDNANKLARAYLGPLSKNMCRALSSGWFMGSEKLQAGHFELFIIGNASFAPQKDKTFDIATLGLSSNVYVASDGQPLAPTALSPSSTGSHIEVATTNPNNGDPIFLTDFPTPEGLGIPFVPLPMAQLQVGLIKDTELMVRILPQLHVDYDEEDYATIMWGLGLKHHLAQWIPSLQKHSMDIVIGIAYARQKAKANLSRTTAYHWQDGKITSLTEEQKDQNRYNNQAIHTSIFSMTLRTL